MDFDAQGWPCAECAIEKKAFATADAWLSEQRALWEARFDRLDFIAGRP